MKTTFNMIAVLSNIRKGKRLSLDNNLSQQKFNKQTGLEQITEICIL